MRVDHQHATNDFFIAPHLAESGAHSMNGLATMDGLMKEPCAQLQHATNDFCIAPRPAEAGAHSMDTSFSTDFPTITGPTRVWGWIISTQQTTFVWRLVLRNLALTGWPKYSRAQGDGKGQKRNGGMLAFKACIFFAPGTLVDLPLARTIPEPGCPPAPPLDH